MLVDHSKKWLLLRTLIPFVLTSPPSLSEVPLDFKDTESDTVNELIYLCCHGGTLNSTSLWYYSMSRSDGLQVRFRWGISRAIPTH
jgi:hypothetical protein